MLSALQKKGEMVLVLSSFLSVVDKVVSLPDGDLPRVVNKLV